MNVFAHFIYIFGEWEQHNENAAEMRRAKCMCLQPPLSQKGKTRTHLQCAKKLLTNGTDGVSAGDFAEKFGMDVQEAVVFLEWIKVGIKFKTEAVDAAKKSGFSK